MSLRVQVLEFFMVLIYLRCAQFARTDQNLFAPASPSGRWESQFYTGLPHFSGGNDVGVESKDPGLKALDTIKSPESIVSSLF